jgi:hypothetical protein
MSTFVKIGGQLFDASQCRFEPLGLVLVIYRGSGDVLRYSYDSAADVAAVINNISLALQAIPAVPPTPAAFVWTSVTPNTATIGVVPPPGEGTFNVLGGGFLGNMVGAAQFFKFDDGGGNVVTIGLTVVSDTVITFTGGFDSWFGVAATYTIYYNPNPNAQSSSPGWISTGLTITAS